MLFATSHNMTAAFDKTLLASYSVLVVEDEGATRHALALLLRLNGYSTAAVGSAEEALDAFRIGPWPAFALVDLDLPGMNGLELIGRLHELDKEIYPILITAADELRVKAALRGQRIVYMQKPVDFHQLISLLDEKCQRLA